MRKLISPFFAACFGEIPLPHDIDVEVLLPFIDPVSLEGVLYGLRIR
jgi:hypothetical protein